MNNENEISLIDKSLSSPFSEELSKRFLQYALSTITSRSLPDVRDGLKPVHRRLLFAMQLLKLDPDKGFKKSARVVGDVMGKFHPHGDAAIYDAMVRMAQEFSLNYLLVEGQGNFGNIDGDNAAAMRYTEARLSEFASLMLDGIDQNAIDFGPTYDGEGKEPLILPSGIPNLLANGAQGIAVGMATSIPPHNLIELFDAAKFLIENKNATSSEICEIIKGPDFPTGGVLLESSESLLNSYKLGKGSFKLRAKWETEKKKNGSWQICINEIPFQIQKSRVIEKIADLINNKKLNLISDIRDESSEEIRIIIEPKSRNLEPKNLMESIFRHTDMEINYNLNLNVLDENGHPRVMSLKKAIIAWLNHRKEVLIRVSDFALSKVNNRLEILESYLIVYLNLDEIIKIIREDENPRTNLVKKFSLNESQANAILDMRLRNLRQLEEVEIRNEKEKLVKKKNELEVLLKSESSQWTTIKKQIDEIKSKFKNKANRKTQILNNFILTKPSNTFDVIREPLTVIISEKGWVKCIKGHKVDQSSLKLKDKDNIQIVLEILTTDQIILFAENGKFYSLPAHKLPSGRGYGEPLSLIIDGLEENKVIFGAKYLPQMKLLLVSSKGNGFIVYAEKVFSTRKSGKQVLNLKNNDIAVSCSIINGDMLAVVGENRKLLIFPIKDVPLLDKGKGVILQRYKDGGCSDAISFKLQDGLIWFQKAGRKRTEKEIVNWLGKRGGTGKMPPMGFPNPPRFNH